MYIKEICLEGFKSYATRTVVAGFDPFFNAITGLNGSGKSNILDSICFVLGITNLSNVRVGSLQELVYKQGQAGITRATVSIVFDNNVQEGKPNPIGYDPKKYPEITVTRQLVVGPRRKYKINGHPAKPSQVQTLFHSVQLNVNNPHFLIMQGRITKVLNMKPPEILSMLEEAVGTRMYETNKISALKTLEKKQNKVDEINKLLDEEILPALEKLRKEKTQYVQWANGNQELDRLRRFCAAFEFVQAERAKDSALSEVTKIKDKMKELDVSMEKLKEQINEKDKSIAKKTAQKEATMDTISCRGSSPFSSGHNYVSSRGLQMHDEWHADLLGCCSEPSLCLKTFFFPCGTFSKISSVAKKRPVSSAEACNDLMAYTLILSCCCYTCCVRRKLRQMLNITVPKLVWSWIFR